MQVLMKAIQSHTPELPLPPKDTFTGGVHAEPAIVKQKA